MSRVFLFCARVFERVRNVFLYAAAGTMRVQELQAAISESWADFNMDDADLHSGLMDWEQSFVDRFVTSSARVLLVGSGTGRDLVALAALGCEVVGIEPSAAACARATRLLREEGLSSTVIEGFFEDAAVPRSFDVIIFSWFCYGYIPASSRRIAVLRKARSHLAPGGRIIVSVVFRQDPPRGRVLAIGRLAGALTCSDWRMEAGDSLDRCGRGPHGLNYEHIFGPGEIEREAAAAGFFVEERGARPYNEPWLALR